MEARGGFGQCGGLGPAEVGNFPVGEPGGLVEELPDGDVRAAEVRDAEFWEVGVDRVVQSELAGVDELHEGEGRERLAERGDSERCVFGDGVLGRIVAVAPDVQDVRAGGDRDRCSGDSCPSEAVDHELVHRLEINRIRFRRGRRAHLSRR